MCVKQFKLSRKLRLRSAAKKSIKLLGHVISKNGVQIDPFKLVNIDAWPVPVTGKQVMHCLGMSNYLRDFIPLYSSITSPLEELRYIDDLKDV